MDEQQLRVLVDRILAEQRARTLMIVTPATGYRSEIAARLRQWESIRWEILACEGTEEELVVLDGIGQPVQWDGKLPTEWLERFDQIVMPFLDFATLAEISLGVYHSPASQLCQYALMKGIPVFAFDYQCNPASELNQLVGLDRSQAMAARVVSQLAQVRALGMITGTLSQVEAAINGKDVAESESSELSKPGGYITLSDVKKRGVGTFTLQDNLTDLAAEYLREQQQS